MLAQEFRHLLEITFTAFFIISQLARSKARNKLAKYSLCLSFTNLLAYYVFRNVRSTSIVFKNIVMPTETVANNSNILSEIFLISTTFLINPSLLSKIYAVLRIPALIYLRTINLGLLGFRSEDMSFFIGIFYGIELIVSSILLLAFLVHKQNRNPNVKILSLLLVTLSVSTYLLPMFKLPFPLTPENIDMLISFRQVAFLFTYAVLANTISNKTSRVSKTIKNPIEVLERENQRISEMIEFSE